MRYPLLALPVEPTLHHVERAAMEMEFARLVGWVIRANGGGNVLEIGTYKGATTWWLAEALEATEAPGRVYTIDPASPGLYPELELEKSARVVVIRDKSENAEQYLEGVVISHVLIDGDHSREGIKIDLRLAARLEAVTVFVHDTQTFEDVRMVVEMAQQEGTYYREGAWTHFPFSKGLSVWERDG